MKHLVQEVKDYVSAKWFGAIGDGNSHPLSSKYSTLSAAQNVYPTATSLTDEIDGLAIQKAIDFVVSNAGTRPIKNVYIPGGEYLSTNTIHTGRGDTLTSINLLGGSDISNYRGAIGFMGTIIVSKVSNQPVINIAGARNTRVNGITFKGLSASYTEANVNLLTSSTRDPANWVDPDLDGNADSRYAPYAAITIDGWGGVEPTIHYPTDVVSYNKTAFSSVVNIENCFFMGFVVGIVNRPSDSDGNGDYVKVDKCVFEFCKYGYSTGNTQARLTSIRNCNFICYTCVTTATHGQQSGKVQSVENCELAGFQIFDIPNMAINGPLLVIACYSEVLCRIGILKGRGVATFQSCQLSFNATINKVHERILVDNGGNTFILFITCAFDNYKVFAIQSELATFTNCKVVSYSSIGEVPGANVGIGSPNEKMYRFWRGGLITSTARSFYVDRGEARDSANSYSFLGAFSNTTEFYIDGRQYIHAGTVNRYANTSGFISQNTLKQFSVRDLYLSAAEINTNYSLIDRVLTFDFATWVNILRVGTTMFYIDSGIVFLITDITGDTITAVLQNNYYTNDGGVFLGYVDNIDISPATGATIIFNSPEQFIIAKPVYGDIVSGDTTITNVLDGLGNDAAQYFSVGDVLFPTTYSSDYNAYIGTNAFQIFTKVVGVDTVLHTLTINNGAQSTINKLELFNTL